MSPAMKEVEGKACVSSAFLAEAFRVTTKTLAEWEKQGCPKAARGYWNLSQVLAWREERQNGRAAANLEDMSPIQQKIYWETRCKEAQAENQQYKNAVLRGDYLEKAEVEKELSRFFVLLKQAAMSLPRKAAISAAQYIGNERGRRLENELLEVIRDALDQWSGGGFLRAGPEKRKKQKQGASPVD